MFLHLATSIHLFPPSASNPTYEYNFKYSVSKHSNNDLNNVGLKELARILDRLPHVLRYLDEERSSTGRQLAGLQSDAVQAITMKIVKWLASIATYQCWSSVRNANTLRTPQIIRKKRGEMCKYWSGWNVCTIEIYIWKALSRPMQTFHIFIIQDYVNFRKFPNVNRFQLKNYLI